ncbi:MAG: hypothetical protein AVDCRST_MAG02-2345, partial [uncultured Rubrobacteraceae bacterium]
VRVDHERQDPAERELQRRRGGPQAARALRALDAEAPADGGRGLADLAPGRGGPPGHGRPRRGGRRGRVRRRHRRLHGGHPGAARPRSPPPLLRGGRLPGRGRRPPAPRRAPGGGPRLGGEGRWAPPSTRQRGGRRGLQPPVLDPAGPRAAEPSRRRPRGPCPRRGLSRAPVLEDGPAGAGAAVPEDPAPLLAPERAARLPLRLRGVV